MSKPIRLRSGALEWREVEGEIVALDVRTSTYFAVNATGAVIWQALIDGASRDELVSRVREAFPVDEEVAAKDLDAFLAALREQNLLED
jgi:hypothetical protein